VTQFRSFGDNASSRVEGKLKTSLSCRQIEKNKVTIVHFRVNRPIQAVAIAVGNACTQGACCAFARKLYSPRQRQCIPDSTVYHTCKSTLLRYSCLKHNDGCTEIIVKMRKLIDFETFFHIFTGVF